MRDRERERRKVEREVKGGKQMRGKCEFRDDDKVERVVKGRPSGERQGGETENVWRGE